MLESSGIPFAVVCPSVLFDNLSKFQGDVIRLDRALYGLGRGEAAFVDARDVADCVVSVLLNPHRYTSRHLLLTGKEVVTGEQLALGMSRVYQTSISHKVVSEAEMRAVLTRRGVPPFMQDDLVAVERLANDRQLTLITPTVKEVAGHPPRTMETFLAAYKSQLMPSFSLSQLSHFFM
jgi:NAD(P)H dehydrogenase (quinone)